MYEVEIELYADVLVQAMVKRSLREVGHVFYIYHLKIKKKYYVVERKILPTIEWN